MEGFHYQAVAKAPTFAYQRRWGAAAHVGRQGIADVGQWAFPVGVSSGRCRDDFDLLTIVTTRP
jgi:hypothetical protein